MLAPHLVGDFPMFQYVARAALAAALLALAACSATTPVKQGAATAAAATTRAPLSPADEALFRQLPANANKNPEFVDWQRALMRHGTYLTDLASVALLDSNQCGGLVLEAHRGDPREAENSLNAIARALDAGTHAVEIDITQLRDGIWVVNHDHYTGRAIAHPNGGKPQSVDRMNFDEWSALRHRDGKTGRLSNTVPPTFLQAIATFKQHARPGQTINIELKEDLTINAAADFIDHLEREIPGQYAFSSSDLETLSNLRSAHSTVYLAFIREPARNSVKALRETLERGAGDDNLYGRYSDYVVLGERINYWTHKPLSAKDLAKISQAVGGNGGIHVDVRDLIEQPKLAGQIRAAGIKTIATYSINGHNFHMQQLEKLVKRGQRPDRAIADAIPYQFCRTLQPVTAVASGPELPGEIPALIADLPADADLQLLGQQRDYAKDGRYLALSGVVKRLPGAAAMEPEIELPTLRVGAPRKASSRDAGADPLEVLPERAPIKIRVSR